MNKRTIIEQKVRTTETVINNIREKYRLPSPTELSK